jgi:hypothetical protein
MKKKILPEADSFTEMRKQKQSFIGRNLSDFASKIQAKLPSEANALLKI